jgi:hypothetical protein
MLLEARQSSEITSFPPGRVALGVGGGIGVGA